MVKLIQKVAPADKASWDEHFYTGRLPVVNGVADTDNPVWIFQLQQRGFRLVDEENAAVTGGIIPSDEQLRDKADEVAYVAGHDQSEAERIAEHAERVVDEAVDGMSTPATVDDNVKKAVVDEAKRVNEDANKNLEDVRTPEARAEAVSAGEGTDVEQLNVTNVNDEAIAAADASLADDDDDENDDEDERRQNLSSVEGEFAPDAPADGAASTQTKRTTKAAKATKADAKEKE